MASKKQEIRKQLKKQEAKEIEALGLNTEVEVVDLNDDLGEEIVVETFEDVIKKPTQPIEFNTTPQKQRKGLFGTIKSAFSQDNSIVKKLEKQAQEVLNIEAQYQAMSDEELAHQTDILRDKIASGSTLDDIMVEAFATVREAAFRKLGLKAFKVQIMGAISLHNGDIAEMKTGEGKTLTSVFPVYLNALEGKGVHVVTVNDYLAGRDKTDNGKVYEFLGLTVGLNKRELS
ncbi:MAG: preprotein translocase subunit SecA, partial [Coprobacillus sp.]